MTRLLALLLLACSGNPAVPSLTDPICPHVELDSYTAGDRCILLKDKNGRATFRRPESEACGGVSCMRLQPGETGIVLGELAPGPEPEWLVLVDACESLPACD